MLFGETPFEGDAFTQARFMHGNVLLNVAASQTAAGHACTALCGFQWNFCAVSGRTMCSVKKTRPCCPHLLGSIACLFLCIGVNNFGGGARFV